jgi:hypothetical protein
LHAAHRSESRLWLLHLAGKSGLVDWQVCSLIEFFVVEIVIFRLTWARREIIVYLLLVRLLAHRCLNRILGQMSWHPRSSSLIRWVLARPLRLWHLLLDVLLLSTISFDFLTLCLTDCKWRILHQKSWESLYVVVLVHQALLLLHVVLLLSRLADFCLAWLYWHHTLDWLLASGLALELLSLRLWSCRLLDSLLSLNWLAQCSLGLTIHLTLLLSQFLSLTTLLISLFSFVSLFLIFFASDYVGFQFSQLMIGKRVKFEFVNAACIVLLTKIFYDSYNTTLLCWLQLLNRLFKLLLVLRCHRQILLFFLGGLSCLTSWGSQSTRYSLVL